LSAAQRRGLDLINGRRHFARCTRSIDPASMSTALTVIIVIILLIVISPIIITMIGFDVVAGAVSTAIISPDGTAAPGGTA